MLPGTVACRLLLREVYVLCKQRWELWFAQPLQNRVLGVQPGLSVLRDVPGLQQEQPLRAGGPGWAGRQMSWKQGFLAQQLN